ALGLAGFAFCWVSGFDIIYATLDEGFDREHHVQSAVAWLGRARALRLSWVLHLLAMGALAAAVCPLALGAGAPRSPWAGVTLVGLAGTVLLLWLEQRWAEDVNLAFFKTNVVVGFVVLATVLAARMAGGGFR